MTIIPPTDGIELMIMIIATFGQALSGTGHAVTIIGVLVTWRFIVSFLDPSLFTDLISYPRF